MDYRLGPWRYAGPFRWQQAEVLLGSSRCSTPGCDTVIAEGEIVYRKGDSDADFCAVCALRMIQAEKDR